MLLDRQSKATGPRGIVQQIRAYERAIWQARMIGWPALEQSFRQSLKALTSAGKKDPQRSA